MLFLTYSKLNSKCTALGFPLKVSLSNHNGKRFTLLFRLKILKNVIFKLFNAEITAENLRLLMIITIVVGVIITIIIHLV